MAAVRTVPTAPLDAYLRARFDTDADTAAALGVKTDTVRGWRHRPSMTVFSADRLAVRLGRHPYDIWGWGWFEIPDPEPRAPRTNKET